MNWWVVTAYNKNDLLLKAVVCEERALGWVREELGKTYPSIDAVPAECHWTAQILHPREADDYCVRSDE